MGLGMLDFDSTRSVKYQRALLPGLIFIARDHLVARGEKRACRNVCI